jgi:hypothetical protein
MKDKVASILGESKTSTHASSHNKISNSHNEESGSDNKPRFYRRDLNSSKKDLITTQNKECKWVGTNFRIVKSPGKRDQRDISANIARVTESNSASFKVQNQPAESIKPKPIGKTRQLQNMGLLNNTYNSRNAKLPRKLKNLLV